MSSADDALGWIDSQAGVMLGRVERWADINSGTSNLAGVQRMAGALWEEFAVFGQDMSEVSLQPVVGVGRRGEEVVRGLGPLMSLRRERPGKPSVLLNIHYDTVYGADDPFQVISPVSQGRIIGPGVADAKGGIAVMLTALEAFERSSLAGELGWEVVLNPDEEIGSPGSAGHLAAAAGRHDVGLLFEPARPDGSLVDRRRGTGTFVIVVRGRAAHSGRDFEAGRSALLAAADLALRMHKLNRELPGVTVNVGGMESGEAVNVVPDLAVLRVNVRTTQLADEQRTKAALESALAETRQRDGISVQGSGGFTSPPKVPDDRTLGLMRVIEQVGGEQGVPIAFGPSGGASDGNRLAGAGLPNIDTLGVRGGNIHSPSEYMEVSSLVERARLAAGVMMKIALGDVPAGVLRR